MGIPYSNLSFGEAYRLIYVRKSCVTADKISDRISDDIPPRMTNLNTVTPKTERKENDQIFG